MPERTAVRAVEELYRELRAEEVRLGDSAAAVDASSRILAATLVEARVSYHEYIFAL